MTKTDGKKRMEAEHLARCGMNCALCGIYQREKKACPGCSSAAEGKPKHCATCAIKACPKGAGAPGCPGCEAFPCKRLLQMDARYRRRFGYSTKEVLVRIREQGIEDALAGMRQSFVCQSCGALLCVHERACPACGRSRGGPF